MVARAGPKKGKGRTGVSGLLDNAALLTGGARGDNRNPRGMGAPARKEKNRRAPDFVSSSTIPPADPSSESAYALVAMRLEEYRPLQRKVS